MRGLSKRRYSSALYVAVLLRSHAGQQEEAIVPHPEGTRPLDNLPIAAISEDEWLALTRSGFERLH